MRHVLELFGHPFLIKYRIDQEVQDQNENYDDLDGRHQKTLHMAEHRRIRIVETDDQRGLAVDPQRQRIGHEPVILADLPTDSRPDRLLRRTVYLFDNIRQFDIVLCQMFCINRIQSGKIYSADIISSQTPPLKTQIFLF